MKAKVIGVMVAVLMAGVILATADAALGETPYNLAWFRLLGTSGEDQASSVSVDGSGNAYITGLTTGNLGGPNQGGYDAFLAKYSSAGGLLWTAQLGTGGDEHASGVSVDGSGNAYITGLTTGNLGGPNYGGWDAFLAKYSPTGGLLWKAQLGTGNADSGAGVAVDGSGNAFVTGQTYGKLGGMNQGGSDAFLAKYSPAGSLLWTAQLGTGNYESAFGVSVDGSGNAYITGYTSGNLGGPNQGGYDAFLAKYSSAGDLVWTAQLGTAGGVFAYGVSVDGSGSAYIMGLTGGNLGGPNQGQGDAFLAKYSSAGGLLWTAQLGTAGDEHASGVSVDGSGNAYITGYTHYTHAMDYSFLAKYSPTGGLLWTAQSGGALGNGVSVDGSGNAYITGVGGMDAFLAKYEPVPEPATLSLLALGGLGLIGRGFRTRRQ
jgi:hypothetical protein